jgi:NADH dehydrogenase
LLVLKRRWSSVITLSLRLVWCRTRRIFATIQRSIGRPPVVTHWLRVSEIFRDKTIKISLDTVKSLDREAKQVSGKSHDYKYDILVVALGVVTNYFGIKGLDKYSYGIKSQEEANRLRNHIHKLLLDEGKPDLNYVVIGGGPTGVELAGALPAYIKHVMRRHGLRDKKLHIDLVEAAPRLMPRMPKSYSQAIARRLRRLGVTLYLREAVQAETADGLEVGDHSIESHTVAWTAGVTNHPFFSANKFDLSEHGKVHVDQHLMAETDVYVIGDNAETPYSGMAQTALYDAKYLAGNLRRLAAGKRLRTYTPKKPIYVTPVGGRWAAVLWNNFHIYGWLGWFLRSAADFVGYHDYEPWWTASKHWLAEYEDQDTCQICAGKQVTPS